MIFPSVPSGTIRNARTGIDSTKSKSRCDPSDKLVNVFANFIRDTPFPRMNCNVRYPSASVELGVESTSLDKAGLDVINT